MRRSGKRRQQNHKDLRKELQKIWNVIVKIIPLVVSSLGAVTKQLGNRLKENGVTGYRNIMLLVVT